jgi:hypothetical protein
MVADALKPAEFNIKIQMLVATVISLTVFAASVYFPTRYMRSPASPSDVAQSMAKSSCIKRGVKSHFDVSVDPLSRNGLEDIEMRCAQSGVAEPEPTTDREFFDAQKAVAASVQ